MKKKGIQSSGYNSKNSIFLDSVSAKISSKNEKRIEKTESFIKILQDESFENPGKNLKDLLSEFDQTSNKFVENPNLSNLKEFRNFLRQILSKIQNEGYRLKKYMSKAENRNGYSHSLREHIIIEINSKLESISELILNRNQKAVYFLTKIEDIRGLLINLLS